MDNATPAPQTWKDRLIAEVKADPRGKAGVAERLGVSRAYVSRALTDGASAYRNVPEDFVRRVLGTYHIVVCPATNERRDRSECRSANGAAPTHNPLAMRIWRTCQQCQHKPPKEAS